MTPDDVGEFLALAGQQVWFPVATESIAGAVV
jgi:hypothetical protein